MSSRYVPTIAHHFFDIPDTCFRTKLTFDEQTIRNTRSDVDRGVNRGCSMQTDQKWPRNWRALKMRARTRERCRHPAVSRTYSIYPLLSLSLTDETTLSREIRRCVDLSRYLIFFFPSDYHHISNSRLISQIYHYSSESIIMTNARDADSTHRDKYRLNLLRNQEITH